MSEQDKSVNTVWAAIGKFFGFVILFTAMIFTIAVVNGYATMKLWNWFMHPIFGIRALSLVQAIGISVVVAIFTTKAPPRQKEKTSGEDQVYNFLVILIIPLMLLLFGWIVTWFM